MAKFRFTGAVEIGEILFVCLFFWFSQLNSQIHLVDPSKELVAQPESKKRETIVLPPLPTEEEDRRRKNARDLTGQFKLTSVSQDEQGHADCDMETHSETSSEELSDDITTSSSTTFGVSCDSEEQPAVPRQSQVNTDVLDFLFLDNQNQLTTFTEMM